MSHPHHHGHSHGAPAAAEQRSRSRLRWALGITSGFLLVELFGGWYAHSLALLADAGHMLTDVLSLSLAYAALHASGWSADARRTYGYRRYQVLAAFVNGMVLLAISVAILVEALLRLRAPAPVAAGLMLAVAVAGLGVNLMAYAFLHRAEDLNTRAALAHVIGDLLGSAAAILAAVIILLTGWTLADPVLSAVVALLLLRMGIALVRQSGHVLLEGAPEHLDLSGLEPELIAAVPGLLGVHHVHAWSLTPEQPVMTLHAVLREESGGDDAIARIVAFLRTRYGITHVTVQVERAVCKTRCA